MRLLSTIALLPAALAGVLPRDNSANYDGHKVYRIQTNGNAAAILSALSPLSFKQWNYATADHMDISLPASQAETFKQLNLPFTVMHEDLGADIRAESAGSEKKYVKRAGGALPSDSWFDSYHSYADHVQFWKDLNAAFPKNSQYFVAGKSVEKRDIFGLKLFGNNTSTPKEAVIWHSTVHAREWITTMTVEYIAYNMILGYKASTPDFVKILDTYDIYILPVVNPDGFVYTQTNDRLWRKNRSAPPVLGAVNACKGTDVNRNWPYQWIGDPQGSSPLPCAETYRGRSAGSEPENKALVNHMKSIAARQKIYQYVDWHSYGEYILSPYGYTAATPGNSDEQVALGGEAAEAIRRVHGKEFTVGPSGATLYPTTGSSADFATDVAGAEFAYALELRGGGEGAQGFVLPPEQIRDAGEEMLAGARVFLLNG